MSLQNITCSKVSGMSGGAAERSRLKAIETHNCRQSAQQLCNAASQPLRGHCYFPAHSDCNERVKLGRATQHCQLMQAQGKASIIKSLHDGVFLPFKHTTGEPHWLL